MTSLKMYFIRGGYFSLYDVLHASVNYDVRKIRAHKFRSIFILLKVNKKKKTLVS